MTSETDSPIRAPHVAHGLPSSSLGEGAGGRGIGKLGLDPYKNSGGVSGCRGPGSAGTHSLHLLSSPVRAGGDPWPPCWPPAHPHPHLQTATSPSWIPHRLAAPGALAGVLWAPPNLTPGPLQEASHLCWHDCGVLVVGVSRKRPGARGGTVVPGDPRGVGTWESLNVENPSIMAGGVG